jgi:hypothetical protein
MSAIRRAAFVAAIVMAALSLELGVSLATPSSTRAAGCLAGTSCASLTVSLTGYGNGSWATTDSAGTPDGVVNCYYGGALYPSTCNHRFEWDRVSTRTIYWKATAGPNSKVVGPASGSVTLTNGQTSSAAATFEYEWPELVRITRIGSGTVTSNPAGLSCAQTCTWGFNAMAPDSVLLSITADPGWTITNVTSPQGMVSCSAVPSTFASCMLAKTTAIDVYVQFTATSALPSPTAQTPTLTPPTAGPTTAPTVVPTPTPAASKKGGKAGSPQLSSADGSTTTPVAVGFVALVASASLFVLVRSRRRATNPSTKEE